MRSIDNYLIDHKGKEKLFHTNLLKQYHRRAYINLATVLEESSTQIEEPDAHELTFAPSNEDFLNAVENFSVTPDGRIDDYIDQVPAIGGKVSPEQFDNIVTLTTNLKDVLSEIPGYTSIIEHDIQLCSSKRDKPKLYPIPLHIKLFFQQEVEEFLQQGIIQTSKSPHWASVVVVKKFNGNYCLAVEFHVLHAMTTFDVEPISTITEDLHKFFGGKYFSEPDLTKFLCKIMLEP